MLDWIFLKLVVYTAIIGLVDGLCPGGWRLYNTSCYRVFGAHATFHHAYRRCAAHQGHLLTVKKVDENNFVKDLISMYEDDQFWFGIMFNATGGFWMDDESQVTWSLWTGHGTLVRPACALMVRGLYWTSKNCDLLYQYVCEITLISRTTRTNSVETIEAVSPTAARPRIPVPTTLTNIRSPSPQPITTKTLTTIAASPTTIKPSTTTLTKLSSPSAKTKLQPTTKTTTPLKALTILAPPPTTQPSETTITDAPENTTDAAENSAGTNAAANMKTTTQAEQTTQEIVIVYRKKNPVKTYNDNRPSAIGIGSFGVCVLILILLGVFLLDASKLMRDFKMLRNNMRHFSKSLTKWISPKGIITR